MVTLILKAPRLRLVEKLACGLCFGWLILLNNLPAGAQEVLATNRATELRANPDDGAASLQSLPSQASVQLLERRGAWSKVKSGSQTGWVRMMHLRGGVMFEEAPPQSKSSGLLSRFNRILGGSPQTSQRAQSATVGIRGLSPEELKAAAPNPEALAAARSFAVSKLEAEQFAKAASLAAVKVDDPVAGGSGGAK
ncbi:MAG: SH3 domain-containing protein [Rhodocyclaceae bacterium]|nr:SH3 domain-containing protein [Rhodocyclaceae bacterium]